MVLNKFSGFVEFKAVDYLYLLILCRVKAIYLSCVDPHLKEV